MKFREATAEITYNMNNTRAIITATTTMTTVSTVTTTILSNNQEILSKVINKVLKL